MSRPRPMPAVLRSATETETDYGGRDRVWTDVATVWVAMTVAPLAQALDGAVASPADAETASAISRDHPLASAGQQLVFDGDEAPWRVRRVDRDAPSRGWMTLRLDRLI